MGSDLSWLHEQISQGLCSVGQTSNGMASLASEVATLARGISAEVEDLLKGTATDVDQRMLGALDGLMDKFGRAAEEFGEVARIVDGASFGPVEDGRQDHCAEQTET